MYETLLVDGTDLASVVACVQSLDGLYSVGVPRGDNIVFPGVDGETHTDKALGTGTVELGIILAGTTTAEFNDSFRALKTLIQPGKVLGLERDMSFTSGNEQHVASGEYASGLNPTVSLMRFGRTTVSIKLLDGCWFATSPTTEVIASGAQSITVLGEIRTHAMTVTMGPGDSITNTTTGHTLTNSAGAGGSVEVDVINMTATQDGNDVSGTLTWSGRYPMRLAPGVNDFTGDGSTISYTAAYQ